MTQIDRNSTRHYPLFVAAPTRLSDWSMQSNHHSISLQVVVVTSLLERTYRCRENWKARGACSLVGKVGGEP